ncbi:peptidylprolyl isomerase [candidate division KSB1 bacterium]|nr:peptidylprolyl isomerase [candidate division KSB1 bacterium]
MSKRYFSPSAFLLIALLSIGLTQCSRDNRTVAQIGTHERITSGEFEKSFASLIEKLEPGTVDHELIKGHLDDLIESRLIMLAAYDKKLDQDSVMLEKMKEFKRRTLIDQLWQNEIVDYIVGEQEIRDFYAKSDIQINARQIVIYVDAKGDSTEEMAALEKANDLIQKVKDSQSFSRLARQYSDDRKTARKGGEMEPLMYRLDDNTITEAAFNMKKGELSEPIRTKSGYVLLMVDDIQEVNKRTYEAAYDGMKKYILDTRSKETEERAKAYVDTLWNKQNAAWNDETIDTLTTLFRQWKKGQNQLVLIDSLEALPEDFKNRMVFTSNEQNLSVADLLVYYKKMLAQYNRLAMENKKSFQRVLLTELRYRLLQDQAVRDRLDRDEQFIKKMNDKVKNDVISQKRRQIQGDVKPTEDELKTYYEENKDTRYITQKKVEIQEILVRSEDLANELLQRIEAGEDFGELAEKYTTRKGHKEKKGMVKAFGKGAMGKAGEKAFEMSVGEIAGPLSSTDNKQAIIKLIGIIEPEPRPYSAMVGTVRRDFITDVKDKRMADWVAEQTEVRGVNINEDLLEAIRKAHVQN